MHSDIFCQLGIVRCKKNYTLFMFTVFLLARGVVGEGLVVHWYLYINASLHS